MRRAWGRIFDLPGGLVDFDCPHGVTAKDLPAVRKVARVLAQRLATCRSCTDPDCAIKHHTNCRARAILARDNYHCPQGRF